MHTLADWSLACIFSINHKQLWWRGNLLSSQPDYIRLKWSIGKVLQYLLLGQEGNHIILATRLTQGLSWQIILSCFLFCQVGEIKCLLHQWTASTRNASIIALDAHAGSWSRRRVPTEPDAVGYTCLNPSYTTPSVGNAAACKLQWAN